MSVCMRKRAQWEKVKSVSVHKGPEHTYVITLRVNEVEIERESNICVCTCFCSTSAQIFVRHNFRSTSDESRVFDCSEQTTMKITRR